MQIGQKLKEMQLISGQTCIDVFNTYFSDILRIQTSSHAEFIQAMWDRYPQGAPATNGNVFEGLLAVAMYRAGISPIYVQAKLAFVPNVDFDFVLYSEEFGPIVISAKTSLRERYKQADLEGMMLRNVHRRSKSYLLTLDKSAAKIANRKIGSGEILGLDEVVLADEASFNDLLEMLQRLTYVIPPKIEVISSQRLIHKASHHPQAPSP